jgi:hypothetical protein
MLKDAIVQTEEVHLTAAITTIRSGNIKRDFTIRSTLLLKQTSYLLIRAAVFLLLLHTKLKKNVKEDKKIKEEFVRESLHNHPRNLIKKEDLVNQERAPFLEKKLVQKVAKNILNLKAAKKINLNLDVLKILISLVKNHILIKKEEIQKIVENIEKTEVDQIAQIIAKEELA